MERFQAPLVVDRRKQEREIKVEPRILYLNPTDWKALIQGEALLRLAIMERKILTKPPKQKAGSA